MNRFLEENKYIDFSAKNIQHKVAELFSENMTDVQKAEVAYLFVRDEVPHSFDCNATDITAKASDVLRYQTGICHAKSNLYAALLRSQGIPAGFCFERITLVEDASMGYCVHAYNAVYLEGAWRRLDVRGNKEGIQATFSLDNAVLAYPPREEYGEYFWDGIYAKPQRETMNMLEEAVSIQDIFDNITDTVTEKPDVDCHFEN